jgi:hypothetical protein
MSEPFEQIDAAKKYCETWSIPDPHPYREMIALAEAQQTELDRIHKILDAHLGTIIHGLGELVYNSPATYKGRDELTPEEVALRAAYSAAHWIAKDIVTDGSGEEKFDLPSVLDLMKTRKDSDNRAAVAAIQDLADDMYRDRLLPWAPTKDQFREWLRVRAEKKARER